MSRRSRAAKSFLAAVCVAATLASSAQAVANAGPRHRRLDINRPPAPLGRITHSRAIHAPAHHIPPTPSAGPPHITRIAAGSYLVALRPVTPASPPTTGHRERGTPTTADWTQVGSTPLQVEALATGSSQTPRSAPRQSAAVSARITVLTARAARALGLTGLVLRIDAAHAGAASTGTALAIRIPDVAVAGAFGGDYAARLHWIAVPVTSNGTAPVTAGTATHVASRRQAGASVVTVPAPRFGVVLAAVAGPGSATGSFTASTPTASSSWDVSAQTGGFAWSYPMTVPPAPAGPSPSLSLSYNSQSVDGETGGTNNQPNEIGDGWALAAGGYITRAYTPCSQKDNASSILRTSGDLCWNTDNATVSLGGHSGQLVRDSDGSWHLDGDNSRIEHLTGSAAGCHNATAGDECWRLTTVDGTQYFFGAGQLPGGASTFSTWTAPVCGTASSSCSGSSLATLGPFATEGWRWNLDYVVDPHGNSEALYYTTETNNYREANTRVVAYTRGGFLSRIDYGMRAGAESGVNAASARVSFGVDTYGRCSDFGSTRSTNCTTEKGTVNSGGVIAETMPAHTSYYPDTPWDQYCTNSTCTGLVSPTFFSGQMLATITASVWTGSAYSNVNVWTLKHSFPSEGENGLGNPASEWLTEVDRTAYNGSSSLALPPTTFAGITMPNRVDTGDGLAALWKHRVNTIRTDTGTVITVTYSASACFNNTSCATSLRTSVINSPQTNTRLVYPQWWTQATTPAPAPQQDLFNKYVVSAVNVDPMTGGPTDARQETDYIYYGTPAWRFDTSAATPDEDRTWSVYAGYSSVEVRAGDPSTPSKQLTTDYTFFQGMNGDYNGLPQTPTSSQRSGISVRASDGSTVTDSLWWAGQVRESTARLGANGGTGQSSTPVLSDTISTPWAPGPTGSNTYSYSTTDPITHKTYAGTFTTTARLTGTAQSVLSQPVSTGGNRTVTTSNTLDTSYGLLTQQQVNASDRPDTCTSTSYATNTGKYLIDYPSEVATVGALCGQASYPADAVSDTRYAYDTAATGTPPTKGDVTQLEVVKAYAGTTAGSAVWLTTARTSYDALGRPTAVTDALGRTTTTAYTPAAGGPLTQTVATDPAPFNAWTTTTSYNPAWGTPLSITDPNAHVTTATYDPLGRVTGVWLPDRPYSSHTTSPSTGYAYTQSATAPLTVAATTLNASGSPITSYQLYDSLGRLVQAQQPSEAGPGVIITDTGYDAAGHPNLSDSDWYDASHAPSTALRAATTTLPGQVTTSYDGAGRPTLVTQYVDGNAVWHSSYGYTGADRTDLIPPAGGTPTTTYTDSAGKTSKLTQYLSADLTGTPESTTYSYDARGDMTQLVKPAGSVWAWAYDALGRRVAGSDPDSGTTSTSYNDDGTVASSTDARGATLNFGYDNLGRKTSESDGAGTTLATWAYDPTIAGTQYKGQPASATRVVPGTGPLAGTYTSAVTGYDANYRPTGSAVTVPSAVAATFGLPTTGVSYATSTLYATNGSVFKVTEPAAAGMARDTVTYNYTALGHVSTLGSTGVTSMLGNTTFSYINQIVQLSLTNGSTEVDRTFTYADGTARLMSASNLTNASTNFHVGTDSYAYTDSGSITSDTRTADTVATDTQCYSYDPQQNLTEAWTPASNNCATARSSANLGGPAPYWTSYRIDPASGNRTSTVQHATSSSGTDQRASYAYPAAAAHPAGGNGPGGPNAVSTVSTATAPAGTDPATGSWTTTGTDSYAYNQTGSTSTAPGQTISYDTEGHPASTTITAGANTGTSQQNVYSPDGNLLVQTDAATGSTLFLGDTEIHATPTGTITGTRTYTANGTPIAERSTTGGTNILNWLCPSPNSTTNLEINALTLQTTRRYSDPYGNPRGTNPTWSSTHTYLNAPQNRLTNTIHLGARDYAPTLGRFLTLDPILETADPQAINGYSYANNNPIAMSDPTGLEPRLPGHCFSDDPACNNTYGGTEASPGNVAGDPCVDYGCRVHPGAALHALTEPNTGGVSPLILAHLNKPGYMSVHTLEHCGSAGDCRRARAAAICEEIFAADTCFGLDTDTLVHLITEPRCSNWKCDVLGLLALVGLVAAPFALADLAELTIAGAMRLIAARTAAKTAGDVATNVPRLVAKPNFTNPAESPGTGWEWRGTGDPGTSKGSWYNPNSGESLHPDLGHPDPIGPHYDWKAPDGTTYRVYPDGTVVPK